MNARRPLRIVVAEDEAIIRLDLREMLEEEGYEVVADVGRGDEAVEQVRRQRPDAAIFDVKMPGLDGIAATRLVSAERLCPVIMLTAFSQREVIDEARDAGALGYIVKPFQRTDLVPAIELAVARFEELRALVDERDAMGAKLELRKLVERAKGLLQDRHHMSEADAFAFLQRTAMSSRVTMAAVADGVVSGRIVPE